MSKLISTDTSKNQHVSGSLCTSAAVHEQVFKIAKLNGRRAAISDVGGTFTYAEYVAHTNALGRYLQATGVKPGDTVGVHLPRGRAMAVAMLAVSALGACSLLLDVDCPSTWLEQFIESATPRVILSHDAASFCPPISEAVQHITLTDSGLPSEVAPDDVPLRAADVNLEQPACLVQTSGTTGVPKLVVVPHRTWTYAATTQREVHHITADTHGAWLFPAHTNVSASVVMWPFLTAGARLSAPPVDTVTDPPELAQWIRRHEITQCFAVAPLAQELVRLEWPPCALRMLLTGSDRTREWAPANLPFEVGNWYGANEVNIVTSSILPWEDRLTSATCPANERLTAPPIGRAWPGVQWWVLDTDGRPTPHGEIGELVVAGEQLALGYLDPRQTADRFVPDPDSPIPGSRRYHTGDLVRYRKDRHFEHHGRKDEQVKINGKRVEMAEVERALLSVAEVHDAAAKAMETRNGPILVGYIVTRGDVSDVTVRTAMSAQVPPHMVPAAIIRMDLLPRNRGDKIDRRALPDPPEPPRTGATDGDSLIDEVIHAVMTSIKLTHCAPDDNIILLGADSLSMNRLAHELNERYETSLTVKELITHPTARELTDLIWESF